MVAEPTATPATNPLSVPVLVTVAAETALDDHSQLSVTSWVVLSVKVAVIVNWRLLPTIRVALVGSIVRLCRTWTVTLRSVFPLTPFRVALIVVVPAATDVATPPGEVIVAIAELDDVQATVVVMSAVDPSE